jgi:hypothetical protein
MAGGYGREAFSLFHGRIAAVSNAHSEGRQQRSGPRQHPGFVASRSIVRA